MSTVNHDPGDEINCIILLFAERTVVLVKQLVDEFVDVFPEKVRGVFSLLEKEGSRVFQLLHIQIFI